MDPSVPPSAYRSGAIADLRSGQRDPQYRWASRTRCRRRFTSSRSFCSTANNGFGRGCPWEPATTGPSASSCADTSWRRRTACSSSSCSGDPGPVGNVGHVHDGHEHEQYRPKKRIPKAQKRCPRAWLPARSGRDGLRKIAQPPTRTRRRRALVAAVAALEDDELGHASRLDASAVPELCVAWRRGRRRRGSPSDTWPHSPPTIFYAGPARMSTPAPVATSTWPPRAMANGRCGTWSSSTRRSSARRPFAPPRDFGHPAGPRPH
jgi:hypothetical protein